jgi:ABC-type transport system involved in multi-copper enzyme maturation permease subunit
MREALRRRVLFVVLALTVLFLILYGLGAEVAFDAVEEVDVPDEAQGLLDAREFAGAFLFGMALFTILFLGAVLAVFLTLGAVRGDAERGLLQPLAVRPVGRRTLLLARFAGAAVVCLVYVLAVYTAALLITHATGGWWPDRAVLSGLQLATAVVVVVALSLLGSVFLSATANGIAVFMVFGAGLTAGLLGQIGEALSSGTLEDIAEVSSWLLPFEALYQASLQGLIADTGGVAEVILQLGPFGGANAAGLWFAPFLLAYLAGVLWVAIRGFERRDL